MVKSPSETQNITRTAPPRPVVPIYRQTDGTSLVDAANQDICRQDMWKGSETHTSWAAHFTPAARDANSQPVSISTAFSQHQHDSDYYATSPRSATVNIGFRLFRSRPFCLSPSTRVCVQVQPFLKRTRIHLMRSSQHRRGPVFVFFIKPGRFDWNKVDLGGICRRARRSMRRSRLSRKAQHRWWGLQSQKNKSSVI